MLNPLSSMMMDRVLYNIMNYQHYFIIKGNNIPLID